MSVVGEPNLRQSMIKQFLEASLMILLDCFELNSDIKTITKDSGVLCHYLAVKNVISKFLSLSFLNANHDGRDAVWSVGKATLFSKLKQGISYCTSRLFNQSQHY